jgi:inorganic pyrophosphatase
MTAYAHNLYFLPSGTVEKFNVVIEIPYGSQNKYELDPKTGAVFLDRVLYGAAFYPGNYGFIPSTKAEDGDAADVIVFMTNPVPPSTVVPCRAVGILKMEDSGDLDSKILAVPIDDPYFNDIKDLSDLPSHKIKELVDFFENMQKFKKGVWLKNVNKIIGVGDKAEAEIEIARYLNNYPEFKE